ncbi:hypothetical protein D3C86_986110 [compost metagenome]
MQWINAYLSSEYVDGGREIGALDCYGLARLVRHLHCGKRLLPSFGAIRNTQPKEFTRAYQQESAAMEECAPEDGAIAAVFRGPLCIHVAVIIELENGLHALEINPKKGARLLRVHDFESQYLRVIYYRDR